jgi:MYND finger
MGDKASFYPHLGFAIKVRILDAEEVHASQDFMTANFEIRHFVDRNYLASIVPAGRDLLQAGLVDPAPPCSFLWGTYKEQDEVVVGMLKKRLSVSINAGHSQGWVQVKLQNVLVVDELPVPFHISLKALKLYPDREVQNGTRLTKNAFPESYHRHPYWNRGDRRVTNVGNPDLEGRLAQNIIQNATGRPNEVKRGVACGNCGKLDCHLQCSACLKVSYCSKACQREAWKNGHREECKKMRNPA